MKKLILLSIIIGFISCNKDEILPIERELIFPNTKWESYYEPKNRKEILEFTEDSVNVTIITSTFNASQKGSYTIKGDTIMFNDGLFFIIKKYSNDTLYTDRKPCSNFIRVK